MKYAKGTQAMLDAAKKDATLLPFDTVFIYAGMEVKRFKRLHDDTSSVAFIGVEDETWEGSFIDYLCADNLLPAKKPKQKKWQNGTQEQLEAAKDDARLIPKKTYFRSKYGETSGMIVYKIDAIGNDAADVLMFNFGTGVSQFMTANELEPINEE